MFHFSPKAERNQSSRRDKTLCGEKGIPPLNVTPKKG